MALRAPISGKIVDIESKHWKMDGREGVTHAIFVRTGNERDGAQRIRISFEQLPLFTIGHDVTLPCDITAQANNYGASLRVTLDDKYATKSSGTPQPVRTPASV